MIVYICFFIVLLLLYYYNLHYIVHSLILLEFISFYLLSLFGVTGNFFSLGQFFIIMVFLVFVLEGVIGIISIIIYTNYAGSANINVSAL